LFPKLFRMTDPEVDSGAPLACQRNAWALPEGHFYFDGAGKAMLPRRSVDAGVALVSALAQPWTVPGATPPRRPSLPRTVRAGARCACRARGPHPSSRVRQGTRGPCRP